MHNFHNKTIEELAIFLNNQIISAEEISRFFLTFDIVCIPIIENGKYVKSIFNSMLFNRNKIERIILALADPRLYRNEKLTLQALKVLNEILKYELLEIRLINGIAEIIKLNKETIMRENHELMFNILLELEGDIKIDLSEYSNDEINFTKELLIDKKLAEGTIIDGEGGHKFIVDLSLTPSGHEYLLAQKNKKKYNLPYTIGDNIYESNESDKIIKTKATYEDNTISIIIHKAVFDHVKSLLVTGHYFNAVEEAYKIVREKLKSITGNEKATDSFKPDNHIKIFGHEYRDDAEKDFYDGVKYLHMAIQFLRNEKSHTPARVLDKNLAIHYIVLASLAYDLIDR